MKRLIGVASAAFLAFGVAGSADAGALPYSGTLTFQLSALPGLNAVGGGTLQVNGSLAGTHLSSLVINAGDLGPVTASLPVTSTATINSVIFTALANASGSFTPAGGLGGGFGGPMGVSGTAKICLKFSPCQYSNVTVPLSPNTAGAGFGVGGTQVVPGNVAVTMQHGPWTTGLPSMTIHTAGTSTLVPNLPGGFVHGPATGGASSAAAPSGVVQLVAVSKTYTTLTGSFPELPLIGILKIHFVPEPGTMLLLASGVVGLGLLGRRRHNG
jgi:hypothetical protein